MNNRFASYEQNEGLKMVGDSVVCPKPRRLSASSPSVNDYVRSSYPCFNQYQTDVGDSQAASELLDLILNRGERSMKQQLASSPPFFNGSPPSRASNPVVQDEQFVSCKLGPFSPTTAPHNSGCVVRMKSGDKPPMVRIEGFDCLSRDRRNCSIPSVA